MKSRGGLAVAIALVSNEVTLTFAQYATTVTQYVNTNPFCTLVSGIGAPGLNGGGAGAGFGPGSGYFNVSGNGTSSATNATASMVPIDTTAAQYTPLGYCATPADGNLLGGPLFTSPLMTVQLCNTDCQGFLYFAVENGDECNCGSTLPDCTPSSSPPSISKRQVTGAGCTSCVGNSAECCGAPGYALIYHVIEETESFLGIVFRTPSSASFFGSTSSSSSFSISSATTTSNASIPASSSASMHNHTTTSSPSSITSATSTSTSSTSMSIVPVSAGFGLGPASGNGSGFNPGSGSVFGNGTGSSTSFSSSTTGFTTGFSGPVSGYNSSFGYNTSTGTTASDTATIFNGGDSSTSTATTNGGATATTSSSAESTVESPTPSCVSSAGYVGNNTKYSDYFGYTYDIRCNLNLESTPTDDDAHADSFEDCLEYCSLLTDCVAVSYQDPPLVNSSNCFPKWSFDGYSESAVDGLYSGVNVNGPSPGTLENQNLCTSDNIQGASYDGSTYYDDFGLAWNIGCNDVLVVPAAAALSTTVADTLASCVDYCSVYDACDMVNWTGPHTNGTLDDPNCFPASSNGSAGAADSAPGSAYALLSPD